MKLYAVTADSLIGSAHVVGFVEAPDAIEALAQAMKFHPDCEFVTPILRNIAMQGFYDKPDRFSVRYDPWEEES